MITTIRLPNGRVYSGTLMRPYLIARVTVLAIDDGRHYPAWRMIEYDTGILGDLFMTRKEAMAAARALTMRSRLDKLTNEPHSGHAFA